MERRKTESRLYTIRGKIWLMVIMLAVSNGVCSSIAFVAATFLTTISWLPVLAVILVSTAVTVLFAWWMSNDILKPLDKLILLAKSIERSPGMSVPKTTGAVETDDLLHTISRTSRQLTNIVDLMDDVSAGNTKAALDPLEHSDRLSESFRKIVAKVTDSIDAKAELERLNKALVQLSSDLAGIARGAKIQFKNEHEAVTPVVSVMSGLLEQRNRANRAIGSASSDITSIAAESRKQITDVIEKDSIRTSRIETIASTMVTVRSESEKAFKRIATDLTLAKDLFAELSENPLTPAETARSFSGVKKQFDAAMHKLRDIGEQSLAITHVSKLVQDLAKRSSLISLNASIQTNGSEPDGYSVIANEIASLSERAEKANKSISGISEAVIRDIQEANACLQWVAGEIAEIAVKTSASQETTGKMVEAFSKLDGLLSRLESEHAERSSQTEKAIKTFEGLSSYSEEVSAKIRSVEENITLLQKPLEELDNASIFKNRMNPADRGVTHPEPFDTEPELNSNGRFAEAASQLAEA